MYKTLIVLISTAFLAAACLPGQSAQEVQAQVETAVAQTMEAQQQIENSVAQTVQAQNALASPTVAFTPTLTSTPILFPTLTPIVATVTPIPVSSGGGGGGGGGGVSKAAYSCDIIHQRPFDNSEIIHGGDFDIRWTILNTGTKTWDSGVDVKYWSGPKMTSVTRIEIPKAMAPGDQYEIVLDATAPTETGRQVMTWAVDGQYCYPYVAIMVK